MKLKFDHINVTVSDIEESIRWYSRVFGFELVESGLYPDRLRWAIVGKDDSMVCMTEHEGRSAPIEGGSPHHQIMHFGIRISDRSAWLQTIEDNRLRDGFLEKVEYPNSTSWYLRDPSGHKLEVSWSETSSLAFPAEQMTR